MSGRIENQIEIRHKKCIKKVEKLRLPVKQLLSHDRWDNRMTWETTLSHPWLDYKIVFQANTSITGARWQRLYVYAEQSEWVTT